MIIIQEQEIISKTVTTIKWTEIVTALVVIYSAALSTFNFFKNLNRDKIKAKVQFMFEITTTGAGTKNSLNVEVENIGYRDMYVALFGIQVKGDKTNYYFQNQSEDLLKLKPGETAYKQRPMILLNKSLNEASYTGEINIRPFVKDASSKFYKGKYIKYNPEKFEIPIKKSEKVI